MPEIRHSMRAQQQPRADSGPSPRMRETLGHPAKADITGTAVSDETLRHRVTAPHVLPYAGVVIDDRLLANVQTDSQLNGTQNRPGQGPCS